MPNWVLYLFEDRLWVPISWPTLLLAFILQFMKKRLNIFIDESGSFAPLNGNIDENLPISDSFYIFGLIYVFDNDENVYKAISQLNKLKNNFEINESIHYGPLLRHEGDFYKQLSYEDIRNIYFKTASIVSNNPIYYSTIVLNKKTVKSFDEFEEYFINNFGNLYISNNFFRGIEEIKVYYDNGQDCVSRFIKDGVYKCFLYHKDNIFNAKPKDYSLLQIADFICTSKLIDLKRDLHVSSKSEQAIFNNTKKYRKYMRDLLSVHRIN